MNHQTSNDGATKEEEERATVTFVKKKEIGDTVASWLKGYDDGLPPPPPSKKGDIPLPGSTSDKNARLGIGAKPIISSAKMGGVEGALINGIHLGKRKASNRDLLIERTSEHNSNQGTKVVEESRSTILSHKKYDPIQAALNLHSEQKKKKKKKKK
ncbi:hypothetical protein PROFUN_14098 [Planoprotostelium fungivorum]|uniref:Uncharacterized protein n=1 Tax=Planoprotostelium fungivorum TaxID=1890364 RepID=A0A2P6N1Y9_9EUKA|nr:hypothetical protein PROFUN_14098 [Planoprotostelium fungivorum]